MATQVVPARLEELRIERHERARGPRKRRLLLLGAGVLVLVAVAAALLLRPPSVAVGQIRQVRPGEQQTVFTAAGYVTSRRQSILAPKIPGRLVAVVVEEGDRVKEGQVLARLDDADAKVALRRAQAELSAARASLAERQFAQTRAERTHARTRKLARAGVVTTVALEDARTALDSAVALRAAAAARVDAARRLVEAAELGLGDTVVRAPFDGTVVRKIADEGAVLAPATVSGIDVGGILELVDLEALEVDAEVSEDQLRRVEQGQPALIFLDAFPDATWRAEAASIRPSVDRSRATATVKVHFVDATGKALPGMGARVSFLSEPLGQEQLEAGPQLRVPRSAVIEREGARFVLVAEGERLKQVPVSVGETVGDEYVLKDGPAAGQQVVLAPERRLRDGARVRLATQ